MTTTPTMASKDLSDEYIANVLKSDAHDSSIKYSTLGLQAFLPSKNSAKARKPNTRFLSHLLRDTDAHNAALLAKEQREARERQRAMKDRGDYTRSSKEDKFGRRHESPDRSKKRRRLDDDRSGHGSHKRRRSRSPRPSEEGRLRYRSRSRSRSQSRSQSQSHGDTKRQRTGPEDKDRPSRRRNHHNRDGDGPNEERRRRHVHHQTPPKEKYTSPRRREGRKEPSPRRPSPTPTSSDSDPLEDIVGPAPASKIKPRGRGAFTATSSSTMDTHFNSNYDPSADVALPEPSADDDWDMALEALRDRQKWIQAGAERLKAAGFTDAQVDKWQKSGSRGEKDESDVRWARRGEGREWDRGKVVGNDDEIELRPDWGRLKGT